MDVDKAAAAVADLLTALGVDEGEHSARTPERVARAWADTLSGYAVDPARHLAVTFPAPTDPGLIVLAGLRFRSTCAHHLLPITGYATIGYRPGRGHRIVGLSKLARVLQDYAARLQVQERLGYQVMRTIEAELDPVGVAVLITAEHGCMTLRGVEEPGTVTTTQAIGGVWEPDDADMVTVHTEHSRHR